MNLTDGETYMAALIKRAKSRINILKTPRNTKRRMQKIVIKNGFNTLIVHILCEKYDGEYLFKVNLLSRLPKPLELTKSSS